LIGQEISRRYYRTRGHAWDELTPRVWIGGVLNSHEAAALIEKGVTAVLDLTAEFSEAASFRSLTYKNIPILDLTAPTAAQLDQMVSFIERESAAGIVYVHCKIGYSRTAAVACAYLMRSGLAASVADAIAFVRRVRSAIVIRPEVLEALREFEADEISSPPALRSLNNQPCL